MIKISRPYFWLDIPEPEEEIIVTEKYETSYKIPEYDAAEIAQVQSIATKIFMVCPNCFRKLGRIQPHFFCFHDPAKHLNHISPLKSDLNMRLHFYYRKFPDMWKALSFQFQDFSEDAKLIKIFYLLVDHQIQLCPHDASYLQKEEIFTIYKRCISYKTYNILAKLISYFPKLQDLLK